MFRCSDDSASSDEDEALEGLAECLFRRGAKACSEHHAPARHDGSVLRANFEVVDLTSCEDEQQEGRGNVCEAAPTDASTSDEEEHTISLAQLLAMR